ncbi:MAG: esterase [Solirubrobacterales bacterium]|nr:esterase [Solirubrobacterales bacterium]
MSFGSQASRTHLWLESLGDWSWPGRNAAVEFQPPSWVPALPPPALETAMPAGQATWHPRRVARRRLGLGAGVSALAALCAAVALNGPAGLERLTGIGNRAPAVGAVDAASAISTTPTPPLPPALTLVSQDAAGSSIDAVSYPSAAFGGATGSFLVYLPPGYGSTTMRYPVLYLLHGQNGHATAFLEIGIQKTLDRLIARRAVPPMIAVMIQDRPGLENWRDLGGRRSASYVREVQEMTDRMLPTIATRAARGVAGNSMGGFGAMHVALANPYRFSVVESWLGYFNHLGGELRADRPVISQLGLHAFLYGAVSDPVADPAEDPEFAARLRAAGARARGVIYPGGHSLETVREHLDAMLVFAGRAFASPQSSGAR